MADFVAFVSEEWVFALRHEKKHDDLVADFVPFVSEEWVFALRHEKKRGDLVPDFCSFSVGKAVLVFGRSAMGNSRHNLGARMCPFSVG